MTSETLRKLLVAGAAMAALSVAACGKPAENTTTTTNTETTTVAPADANVVAPDANAAPVAENVTTTQTTSTTNTTK
jgi:hypothetical protein